MADDADAVVVGGGHNGLVAAAYLAKAGRKVVLVEADASLGGAARTIEIAPGFRVSEVAHLVTHLASSVVKDLELGRHGLSFAASDLATIALARDGRHLTIRRGEVSGEIAEADAKAFERLHAKLMRFARVLAPLLSEKPPRLDPRDRASSLRLGRIGLALRSLGGTDMRELLRLILMNIADVLDEEIVDERLKGAIAFDAVLGTRLGPLSPGSLLSYLYRLSGGVVGPAERVMPPKGGMGGVVAALEGAARAAGVQVRTGVPVERIIVEDFRAKGVVLAGGETLRADTVVSAANPRSTLLDLVGARHLETDHVRRLQCIRMKGAAAKLNVALDALPEFSGLEGRNAGARLVLSPSIRAVERAFDAVKYEEAPAEPVLEVTIPSVADPALAPEGKHVLSAIVLYAPATPKAGLEEARRHLKDRAMAAIERHAPGFGKLVRGAELLMPSDIEARCRMPGGQWHHGELAVDQLLWLRPFQAAAQYRSPIDGLWLAGAGSHPGGGVCGLAGANAARAVIAAEER